MVGDLLKWWQSEFEAAEQDYILTRYQPMVIGDGTSGSNTPLRYIIAPDGTLGSISSLAALATWFLREADLSLARRIMEKSVAMGESDAGDILDRHFIIGHMIEVYYRDRNRDPAALHLAIEACQKQIALAPVAKKVFIKEYPSQALPAHGGFEQLAIVREKEKDYPAAIRVATEAAAQGWAGDWAKRISRCTKREARRSAP